MNDQRLPNEIARHLQNADQKLTAGDCAGASEHLWRAGRAAAVIAAHRLNWPADSDDEIYAAMRHIDAECGDQMLILAGYGGAEMFKENASYGFLEKDDIAAFRVGLRHFIDHILTISLPHKDKRDADYNGTRE